MADYINREKLLEHIKDVPTWEIDDKGVHDTKYPKGMFDCEDVVSSIENAPAADVEHVIRCRDCAKDGLTTCPMCWIEKHILQFVNHDPNFYCGAAERRE